MNDEQRMRRMKSRLSEWCEAELLGHSIFRVDIKGSRKRLEARHDNPYSIRYTTFVRRAEGLHYTNRMSFDLAFRSQHGTIRMSREAFYGIGNTILSSGISFSSLIQSLSRLSLTC